MNASFSQKILKCLQEKVDQYNEKHSKTVALEQVIRVYKRGERVSDHFWRPRLTTAQLAMARVNLFLKLAAKRMVDDSYAVQDHDILTASDRSYQQEISEPFWDFKELDYVSARCYLLLAHIPDGEANKILTVPEVEE